jgi:hypothetical protein
MTPEHFISLWRNNTLSERGGLDGWADYTPEMTDATILSRLLALNLERTDL